MLITVMHIDKGQIQCMTLPIYHPVIAITKTIRNKDLKNKLVNSNLVGNNRPQFVN